VSTKNAKHLPVFGKVFPKISQRFSQYSAQKPVKPGSSSAQLRHCGKKTANSRNDGINYVLVKRSLAIEVRQSGETLRRRPDLRNRNLNADRRTWTRLPLQVPLFVRSRNSEGKNFLEFATALNISAGGALVALHGSLRPSAQVSVEIPVSPLLQSVRSPKKPRPMRARIARIIHADGYNLVALRFLRPLQSERSSPFQGRKPASPV
jgi:hypothetical protein